jgi:hypothetical protein
MNWRLKKFLVAVTNLALIVVIVQLFRRELNWDLAVGCLALGAIRLALTFSTIRATFANYFDWMYRIRFRMSFYTGIGLAAVACFAAAHQTVYFIAVLEFLAWCYLFYLWRQNRFDYTETPHGRIPANAWLTPPLEVLEDGTAIITNGTFAPNKEHPLGHAEVVYTETDGKKVLLSTWIKTGFIVNDAEVLIGKWIRGKHHFIALRLTKPLTDEQKAAAPKVSAEMKADNQGWVAKVKSSRERKINGLPMPKSWREKLIAKYTPTGYSWMGLIIGSRFSDHWTCFGSVMEFYARLGLKMRHYGTGILGLGTGLGDPLNPGRLLDDPNFEMLTLDHKAYYEEHGKLPPIGWVPAKKPNSFL